MEITEALNKENELICENQKFKDQLQKAEFEKLQMEITEALNKENELICENQKFKDQLKNADKEVKRLKKENDFQNRKLAELQREYVGINQAHEEESAKMEARIEDLQSQLTIITLQQLKKGKEAEEEQSMEVLETRKIKKRKEIVKVEEKGRKRKKETKKVEDLKNELPELNKERQPVKHLNKDLLNVITELKTGDCLCVEEKSMKFIFFYDILDALHEKSISNNVSVSLLKPVCYFNGICMDNLHTPVQAIDAFCFLLLEERKIKGVSAPRKPIIHDSLIWTHIVREGHRGEANPQLQQELKDGLEASVLIFPMNSAGGNIEASPFHWTILVFDVEARTWTFYNSWLKSKSEANFVKDAELVKDYVHKRRQELLEKEGKTRDKDPFQLIVKEDSPQQKSCSEDCGIIVLYIIEMILNDKVIPEDIPFETVQAYRARIATCLLDSKK
ncbi:PREDICTED: uncharacterized protein LOC105108935 [Populus euphratica]|uniref:Uncharacterized protein LOC105108935 n=1 Tax=Populus euphratica TaxID=75702 RepID=A0AAJ6T055_POPEU|nr:PREDICTED: uncharacterized protein LOC105108935 [Populus euphratica]